MSKLVKSIEIQEDILNEINLDFEDFKSDEVSRKLKGYLTGRLTDIDEMFKRAKKEHSNIIGNIADPHKEKYIQDEIFSKIKKIYFTFSGQLHEELDHFLEEHDVSVDMSRLNNTRSAGSDIRLQRIHINPFSGKFEDWSEFFNLFDSLIRKNTELPEIQKLQYLKTSVCGEAARLIQHLPIESKSFSSAWTILTDRYQNKRKLVNTQLRRLIEQSKLTTESAAGLKSLHDTSIECVHALSNLEIAIEQWDAILIYIIFNKLPQQTQRDWEERLGTSKHLPEWKTFMSFIEARFSSLENISELNGPSKQTMQPNSFRKTTSAACQLSSQQQTKQFRCRLCKASHGMRHCKRFLQMDVKARADVTKKNGVCGNCLGYDHHASACNSSNRCQKCGYKHHTLLHFETQHHQQYPQSQFNNQSTTQYNAQSHYVQNPLSQPAPFNEPSDQPSTSQQYRTHFNQMQLKTLMATALVKVYASNGKQCTLRAFIDTGSEATFITENATQLLNLKRQNVSARVTGLGKNPTGSSKHQVTFSLHSFKNPTFSLDVTAFVLPVLTATLPTHPLQGKWDHLSNLPLADPAYNIPGKIDLLLGADVYSAIILEGLVKGQKGSPVAQRTEFGWILTGQTQISPKVTCFTIQNNFNSLDAQLRQFWEIEESLDDRKLSPEEQKCQLHYAETVQRKEDGRYEVRLPFKNGIRPILGNSKNAAMARFFQIERKLLSNQRLQEAYTKCVQEYFTLGQMKEVTSTMEIGEQYYLPHHAVLKESSSTTKLRVVFDASCKTSNGLSLNDCLMVGPRLQPDIIDLITKWRKFKVAFAADISMMYRQIWMAKEDTPYQLILWRDTQNEPIKTYALNTVTFGTASAPYLAVRTLLQLASDVEHEYPYVTKVLTEGFYVDDLIYGTNDEIDAVKLQADIVKVLKSAGFPLRKWASNSAMVLEQVPESEREINLPLNFEAPDAIKTLGIQWHPAKDTFSVNINLPEVSKYTKRSVLADIARLFDPLGWIAPCVIKAKLILQQLWLKEYSWDDPVSPEIENQWLELRRGLFILHGLEIPRWIEYTNSAEVQLHGFSDASERAYAAVIYARIMNGTGEHIHLLAAKTRVAPTAIKCVSLPRLELCAALLLAKLLHRVKRAMQFENAKTFAWSDSTITLAWIRGNPSIRTTFVANRVSEIQTLTDTNTWRHVGTKDNPADIGSRGLLPQELIHNYMWWHGPKFLKNFDVSQYPQHTIGETDLETKKKENKGVETNSLFYKDNLTKIHANFAQVVCQFALINNDYVQRYSDLSRLVRSTAIWRRYFAYLKDKGNRRSLKSNPITPDELDASQKQLIRLVQSELFPEEIKSLREKRNIGKGSHILSLNPFLDSEELLRVGGRLSNSTIPFSQKHPIILKDSHHFARLIVSNAHQRTLHGGQQIMMADIRNKYWITNLKRLVKSTIHKCIRCHRYNAKMHQQLMGSLPAERVVISRPFTNTGVDFAGPIEMKMWKGRCNRMTKGYIAIFICLSTKAIHIEVVSDLTAAAFIAAFRRFVARRGLCTNMYSDCGTNFKGATADLNKDSKHISSEWSAEVSANLAAQNTKWHFNPPAAPHFGGLWEAGVKSIKHHLKRTIGAARLTFEEYATLLAQIEACLNSRPLCPMTSDPNDLTVLTPGHFLIGASLITLPERNLTEKNINNLDRWRYIQRLTQEFWKQWTTTYLHLLQQRPKWLQQQPNIKTGDIVLVKENNLPPSSWLLARVIELHPGADGLTRVVTIRTEKGVLKRPIAKLSPLLKKFCIKSAVVDTVSEYQESPVPPSPTTPPYQRLTKAIQTDPRCGHEVALGRRVGLYRFCGDIGRGNFSKVKLAVHQLTRDKVAIKVVDRGGLDARALRMLSREVATLECVHHPNILRLFEVVETLGRVYLVTEWVRGGELYNHITQNGPLREIHASPLYKQLLLAVKHMHSLGFVHRDIKAENVLLVSENRLKLADFGFSTELINGASQKLDTFCGSPPYAAPELFSDDHYIGGPVDVWALGVLLYFMVVGNMPFRAPTVPALRTAVLKGDYILPGHISLPCIRLIQRILVHLPARRPTLDDILASQWVTSPNLSTDLMQHEINLRTKPSKRSGFWFRTKSRRIRKSYSLRERYMEISNKPPLNLNTKKTEGIFIDNFLQPIEINYDATLAECSQTSLPRKSFFGSTLKKKISPMDTTKEQTIMNGNSSKCYENRRWNAEAASESPLFKNYDEEKGAFIMLPTATDDLTQLAPLEAEARQILDALGVTSEMLRNATESGPRSDIIGAYRIVINRLQKQSWLAKRHVEIALQEQPKAAKQNRTCTIL